MTQSSEQTASRAAALAVRVTFVIVTALPKEHAAMLAMLDGPVPFRAPGRGATHDYTLGEVSARGGGTHAVALVLADQGNPGAAAYVVSAAHDFPGLNAAMMVGIAGGVPNPAKVEDHVRLGDIVISGKNGVAKYDFIKEHRDRIEAQSPPRPPSALLLAAARRLEAGALDGKRPWEQHVARAESLKIVRPDVATDRLADTTDPSQWVVHPVDPTRRHDAPRVFHGTIASADRLQRNAVHRDLIRDQYNARAVEMEGAGVAEAAWLLECFYFVVRGICDYCDANKNDLWQPYAAVIAAAYTRALLEETAVIEPGVSTYAGATAPLTGDPTLEQPMRSGRADVGRQRSMALAVGLVDADPVVEAEHQAHMDGARELLKRGHARLALDDLEVLKARIWSGASPAVRARVLGLIGHAEFELGHFDKAGQALVAALDHAPTDPKVQASASLGHSLLGNAAAASNWAQTALEKDPTNITARQVLIHQDDREDATVLEEHEKIVGTRTELFFALGHRAARADDHMRAAQWFRRAAGVDATDPNVLAGVGQSILGVVFQRLNETLDPNELTPGDLAQLREAADYLQRAWAALKDDEVRSAYVLWLTSLGNARRLLGEHDAAVSAAEEALRVGRNGTHDVIGFRAAVAMDADDYQRVVELLEGRTNEDPEAVGLLAAAKSNLADYDAAIALWKKMLDLDMSDAARERAECNLLLTLLDAGKAEEARATVARLLNEDSTIPRELLASDVASRLGDTAARDECLKKALGRASRETPRRVLLRLGDALLRAARPGEAASVYELCASPETSERDANRLLIALYRAGRFASALEACRKITKSRGPTRLCAEVESVIHEQLGDLASARAACELYLEDDPNDSAVLLRLATIHQRAGERSAADAVLDRIKPEAIVDNFELGAHLVELLVEAGRTGPALEMLYAVRRRHIDDPRAHLLYISRHIVLGRDIPTPEVVLIDVAVRIEGPGAPSEMLLITEDANPSAARGEISSSQPLAKALLGKRVGDAVTFESAPHRIWKVADLFSKYAFAYLRSLAEFGPRFPENASLEQYEVPEDPTEFVTQLKSRLSESTPQRDKLLDTYGSTIVTVGALGNALGRSVPEVISMVLASRHGLIAAANTAEEKRVASELLDRTNITLVLDFTALIVLDSANVLEAATKGRSVIVAQTTLDALRREIAHWRDVPEDGYMTLGIHEGQLLRHVFSNSDVARARQQMERLLEWGRKHVAPVTANAMEKHADKRELGKLIGECFADSLLLASEEGRVLVSDDRKLHVLARQLFGADSSASLHLLLAQRSAGRIDAQTAATALMTLVVWNYRHVAVDATIMEAAARAEQWRPTGAFARVVDTLKGPDSQLESAIIVAVEFFRVAWFALVLPQQRDSLVMAVLDALATGRNPRKVLDIVRRAVRAKFVVLPHAADDFERVLKLWARMHLLG